jgi:hypothetical protein
MSLGFSVQPQSKAPTKTAVTEVMVVGHSMGSD